MDINPRMRFFSRSTVKQSLFFAIAGPPIASLAVVVSLLLMEGSLTSGATPSGSPWYWLGDLAGLLGLSYIIGFMPALLTGIISAFVRTIMPGYQPFARAARLASPMLIGGAISGAIPMMFPGGKFMLPATGVAAFSSFVCACWLERRLRPGSSPTSAPLRSVA